jgi:hypothetical protein
MAIIRLAGYGRLGAVGAGWGPVGAALRHSGVGCVAVTVIRRRGIGKHGCGCGEETGRKRGGGRAGKRKEGWGERKSGELCAASGREGVEAFAEGESIHREDDSTIFSM